VIVKLSPDIKVPLLLGPQSVTLFCPLEGLTIVAIKSAIEDACCCSSCGRDILVRVVGRKQSSGRTLLELSWACTSAHTDGCSYYDKWLVNVPPVLKLSASSADLC
jgi:hypothetical protein